MLKWRPFSAESDTPSTTHVQHLTYDVSQRYQYADVNSVPPPGSNAVGGGAYLYGGDGQTPRMASQQVPTAVLKAVAASRSSGVLNLSNRGLAQVRRRSLMMMAFLQGS